MRVMLVMTVMLILIMAFDNNTNTIKTKLAKKYYAKRFMLQYL